MDRLVIGRDAAGLWAELRVLGVVYMEGGQAAGCSYSTFQYCMKAVIPQAFEQL